MSIKSNKTFSTFTVFSDFCVTIMYTYTGCINLFEVGGISQIKVVHSREPYVLRITIGCLINGWLIWIPVENILYGFITIGSEVMLGFISKNGFVEHRIFENRSSGIGKVFYKIS